MSALGSDERAIGSIIIAGGGSAGWMTAAALSNTLGPSVKIKLIESEQIGTIGVGEATIPPIKKFNQSLGISEAEFVRETQGSFKLGIEFRGWGKANSAYFHPFGKYGADFDHVPIYQHWLRDRRRRPEYSLGEYSMAWGAAKRGRFAVPSSDRRMMQSTYDYAYHFDAGLYAKYLRTYSEARGVVRYEGKIQSVRRSDCSGDVDSVLTEDGVEHFAEFFIDCTGYRGLLIEETLETGYDDWSNHLPCNRAVAVPCEHAGEFTPYTRSTALAAGWQWRIPLQHRIGNGHVFCSDYMSEDEATSVLLENLDGAALADPRVIRFVTGRRKKFWNRNVVAIGLSAGFMEPLESTSLHLIQTGISRLLALFPRLNDREMLAEEYNALTSREYERVRDFLILHYHLNSRPEPFWKGVASAEIPEGLAYRLKHFAQSGRVVADGYDLFANSSWVSLYIGQGCIPQSYDPLLDVRDMEHERRILDSIRGVIGEAAEEMPTHRDFIEAHCKSRTM
jgi:tryptophan halogenase